MSDDKIPLFENTHERDWVCRDCGIVYCADVDAPAHELPDNCTDCGDHTGWRNKKTGRVV